MTIDNDNVDVAVERASKIKSSLDTRKHRAGQRFSNTSFILGQVSEHDDLRAMLNRIRTGLTQETSKTKQDDEQPA